MTCIAGLEHGGIVTIGSDSQGSSGTKQTEYDHSKLFEIEIENSEDKLIGGFTTSFRMGQLLTYSVPSIDAPTECELVHSWLITTVVPTIRNVFSDHDFEQDDNGKAKGGMFLLGYQDKLFVVQSDYSVLRPSNGYIAVGSGRQAAHGCLYAYNTFDEINDIYDEQQKIVRSIEAASKHTTSVGGAIHTINT